MSAPSPALAEIQALFGRAVQRAAKVTDDATTVEAARRMVAAGVRLSPEEQLEIYREQFWLRHIGALKEDFVTIEHLLGEDGFRALCESYLAARPPLSFTLRDLGDGFADHLAKTEPWCKDDLLLDCARLEWAFVEAFDAEDRPPLDTTALASAPEDAWEKARLVLHPSVQRVALAYPAHAFRAEIRDGKEPARPEPAATHVIVYRGPEKLMYIAIEPLAFDILDRLAAGTPLGAACSQAADAAGVADAAELERRVGAWFQAWAAYGWVSEVRF
jgi:hypothetical protein